MSRVIVKNLPPKATEASIKDFFDSRGPVTDVKLLRKKDGSSRRVAFVGFKSNEQAEAAARFYDDSFMNTTKINVELAKSLHDDTLVSSRDRRKRKNEAAERAASAKKTKSKPTAEEVPDDSRLSEFLEVMKPQSATAMWKNEESQSTKGSAPVVPENESDDEVEEMPGKAQDDEPAEPRMSLADFSKRQETEDVSEQPQTLGSEGSDTEQTEQPGQSEQTEQEPIDTGMSDMDWLRSRQTRIKENGDKPALEPEAVEQEQEEEIVEEEDPRDQNERLIAETGRLFLRNLSYTITEPDVRELFSRYGTIKECHVPVDPKTDKPKGFAYVLFTDPDEAAAAYRGLDGTSFQGRLLHILGAHHRKDKTMDEFDIKNLPLKKQQQLKRKANAAKDQFSWNSLYLNQDAVLETAAAKLGVTKSELMDPTSSNMAVKKALAESSVLQNIQEYFVSKGVDLGKFSTKETNDKIILVKNLPFGTNIEEITDMFGQYGELVRVLMPPEGGLAIVQFRTDASGRAAFTKIAFRRIGNSIIYLQKGPKGILEDEDGNALETITTTVKKPTEAKSTADIKAIDEADDADASPVHTSLFVKNLNFITDTRALANLFRPLAGFVTAQIKTKPDPKNAGKQQSMGFGFVEFKKLEQAQTAMDALQGHELDGHKLQIKLSHRGGDADAPKPKGSATSKIIIKNMPFETTKKDIVELFGSFGQLRTVRLPRKFNKQARGFAFAEFATAKEAEHAMTSLRGTHLLGRRLVMEYAQADAEDPEEEIARMEAKVKSQVQAEDLAGLRVSGQRKAFDMEEDENEGF